jgi:hypothetical protein
MKVMLKPLNHFGRFVIYTSMNDVEALIAYESQYPADA